MTVRSELVQASLLPATAPHSWIRRTDTPVRLIEVNPTAFSMIDCALQTAEARCMPAPR